MVSISSSITATALALAVSVSQVQGHGYILIPESQFTGSATSSWIVQIDPPSGYESDNWDGNTDQSVDTWITLSAQNGVTDIRTLLDDTSLYGADCGYTNPDGTAQPIPSDSTATFSRAIQHVGPCEIWLDDTRVFNDTNCYADYGNEDKDVKSVFPVDYSQCETTGCSMMRFYWLAFQGVDGETVWQVYKDCIPLEGGSGTGSTTSSVSTSETSSTTSSSTASTTSSAATSTASSSDNDLETDASTSSDASDSSTDTTTTTTATPTVTSADSSDSTDEPSSTTAAPSSDSSASAEEDADSNTTTEAPAATTAAPASSSISSTTSSSSSSTATTPSSKCTARERKRG